jgi:hypothetical protein
VPRSADGGPSNALVHVNLHGERRRERETAAAATPRSQHGHESACDYPARLAQSIAAPIAHAPLITGRI